MPLRPLAMAASALLAASPLALTTPATATTPAPATATAASAPAGGRACSRWTDIDGFSDALDKTTFAGAQVGELSGLTPDSGGHLLAVADESSLYTLDARTRQPLSVQSLTDGAGQPLDSEAVAVDRDGTRLIASETEPSVVRFSRSGAYLGRLDAPTALHVAPAGRATRNQTFEGLTLLPGDHTLVASMEGALSGDDSDVRRLQTWRRAGAAHDFHLAAQYAVRVDAGLNISDIAATGDGRLLILERGFTAGVGNTVRLYLADPTHASDVSGTDTAGAASDVRTVRTTLLADIASCPSLGATAKQPQPNPLLDNIEGVTVTGRTHDGRLRLLMVSDDNGNATQTTRLYSLTTRLPRR
ncbi:esterase-like activity of phytase family protein [Streptomyces sp. NPDC004542]|uniref:esterase-like activity of phytase family protein n=1 Tax=Streptomyces sp. NPDC004542 TaxID=3154281 RepID=UPI0033B6E532